MKLGDGFKPSGGDSFAPSGSESLADLWILARLKEAAAETNAALSEYNLMQAVSAVHSFWLYDLCDVYIEVTKPVFAPENSDAEGKRCAQNVLYTCLEAGLRLLHPFMPFVTEELYQRLPRRATDTRPSIMVAPYPRASDIGVSAEQAAEFERVHLIAKHIRSFAAENKLAPRTAAFSITAADAATMRFLAVQEHAIAALTRAVGCLSVGPSETEPPLEDGKEVMHCALPEDISVAFIVPKKQQ
jgi:valyl-tRNA synthetase